MMENMTNHEKYKQELLSNPEMQAKYLLAKEKVHLEMMLETLKEQVRESKSRKTILGQITKISNRISGIHL